MNIQDIHFFGVATVFGGLFFRDCYGPRLRRILNALMVIAAVVPIGISLALGFQDPKRSGLEPLIIGSVVPLIYLVIALGTLALFKAHLGRPVAIDMLAFGRPLVDRLASALMIILLGGAGLARGMTGRAAL